MEQMELEADVYSALTADAALTSLVPVGSIYHLVAPAGKSVRYPYIVYSVSADAPEIHGDNEELYHDVTIRIHIATKEGKFKQINIETKRIMLELGFSRKTTNQYFEDDLKVLVCDYRKMIPA